MNLYPTMFLVVFCLFLILWMRRRRKMAVIKHLLNQKKTDKENLAMKELANRFIGKECFIYTIISDSSNIQGVIKEIEDNGMIIERTSGETELVNLEFVTRIREYPRNKKGKKKSIVLD